MLALLSPTSELGGMSPLRRKISLHILYSAHMPNYLDSFKYQMDWTHRTIRTPHLFRSVLAAYEICIQQQTFDVPSNIHR